MIKHLTPHPKKPQPWLMDKDWPEFYRVRLPDTGKAQEKADWCRENLKPNEWGKSFGSEVFYFGNLPAATLFLARWGGA